MFGSLGGGELLVILVLALLLFGPRKLPEIGRTLGKALNQFRGASQEFRRSLEREVHLSELKETRDNLREADSDIRSEIKSVARGTLGETPDAQGPESESPKDGKDSGPTDAAQA